jgi:hypothetical protein
MWIDVFIVKSYNLFVAFSDLLGIFEKRNTVQGGASTEKV